MLSAGPVSHTSINYIYFVEIFNVSLELSDIYLLVLVGVEVHLCAAVTSIPECYDLFSGVKLSTRSCCFISIPTHHNSLAAMNFS